MSRLIRFEFRKLFRQVSFYVCVIVAMVMTFLSVYTLYATAKLLMENNAGEATLAFALGSVILNGRGMVLNAMSGETITILLAIFVALMICSDYRFQTAKNIIGRGFSREAWLGSKMIVALTGTLILCAVTWLTAYVSGTLFWSAGQAFSWEDIRQILLQCLIMLAYCSLFVFISVLIRSSGGSMAVSIMGPTLLSVILLILEIVIFKEESVLSDYWLAKCMLYVSNQSSASGDLLRSALLGAGYLLLFTGLSYLVVRKRDI